MVKRALLSRCGFVEVTLIIIVLSLISVGLSGEIKMNFERLTYFLLTVGCFGLTIFMLKKWINDVGIKLGELKLEINTVKFDVSAVDTKLTNLLISLPKEYADKKETNQNIEAIWKRIDEHSIAIAKMQGNKNA